MSTEVEITEIPLCDFCAATVASPDVLATVDGRTLEGPWAYMCDRCWMRYGVGQFGTGYGQRLVLREKVSDQPR